jgi:hypothetical protein
VDCRRPKTGGAHLGCGSLGRAFVAIGDHDPRASRGKRLGGLSTYSARAASDDRDAVVETNKLSEINHCAHLGPARA